jgi:hypothetical protein
MNTAVSIAISMVFTYHERWTLGQGSSGVTFRSRFMNNERSENKSITSADFTEAA